MTSTAFRMIPRNKHLWVTGKCTSWAYTNAPPAFFDNSKYFYLYLCHYTNEKVYWLTSSEEEIKLLQSMDLPVVRFPSIRGIMLVLRAKYSFHHYGSDMICPILQRGSVRLNFWHGTPIKKIMYDVLEPPKRMSTPYLDWMEKHGARYISSTSVYLSKHIYSHAFAANLSQFLNFGYPRTDIMRLDKEASREFCKRYSPNLLPYIDCAQHFDKVFLYMPTFRDDDMEYFEKAEIDFDELSKSMQKINAVFFMKLHPLTKHSTIKPYENIVQIGNDVDIYPFLTYTDFLITDYSSILFDYLLLDREIIFIPYDYDHYVSNRALYYDYNEITPGVKYRSFREFIENLNMLSSLDYSKDRRRVYELMYDDYNFDACERTYRFIKETYQ